MSGKPKYAKLREVAERAVDECIKRIPASEFEAAYPHLISERYQGQKIDKVYDVAMDYFRRNSRAQISRVLKSLDVQDHLAILEQVIQNAIARRARYEQALARSRVVQNTVQTSVADNKNQRGADVEVKLETGHESAAQSAGNTGGGAKEHHTAQDDTRPETEGPINIPPGLKPSDMPVHTGKLSPDQLIACHLRKGREEWLAELTSEREAIIEANTTTLAEINAEAARIESLYNLIAERTTSLKTLHATLSS